MAVVDAAVRRAVERALRRGRARGLGDPLTAAAAGWFADVSRTPLPARPGPLRTPIPQPPPVPVMSRAEERALRRRAAAGLRAIQMGADPAVTLSLVVWPSASIVAAEAELERQRAEALLGEWDRLLLGSAA